MLSLLRSATSPQKVGGANRPGVALGHDPENARSDSADEGPSIAAVRFASLRAKVPEALAGFTPTSIRHLQSNVVTQIPAQLTV
jgi:hypothetical protein